MTKFPHAKWLDNQYEAHPEILGSPPLIDQSGFLEVVGPEIMFAGEDGWSEWVHPAPGYRMTCCDCGLVHELQFEIGRHDGEARFNPGEDSEHVVIFRARREEKRDA